VLETEGPAAVAAEVPPDAGSGIVVPAPQLTEAGSNDDYDISGYDLSRYEPADDEGDAEPLQLTGADDPDAADDEDDDVVGAGAGGRRRSRRGGTRRRTRP
jgi:ribonuclease E